MNIFYLSNCPVAASKYLLDKHIVKMPLETVQLLSTAHRVLDGERKQIIRNGRKKTVFSLPSHLDDLFYSATHINHPSCVWTRSSVANYRWLYSYLVAMCEEYTSRYGKTFAFVKSGLVDALQMEPTNIVMGDFSAPLLAMPEHYKNNDAIEAYRQYYAGDKWRFAKWKHGDIPEWFVLNMQKTWHINTEERADVLNALLKKKTLPAHPEIIRVAMELTNEMDAKTIP